MMRIAFNATPLLSPFTGIAQYVYHLASGLKTTPGLNLDFFYGLKWSKAIRDKSIPGIAASKAAIKKIIPNIYLANRFLQQYKFSRGIKLHSSSLYHEPNFLAFKCFQPTIITVHDLSWVRFPETHPLERIRIMNKYFEPGLRCASFIITDSEFIKSELTDIFGIHPNKIKAIPLGVEPLFRPQPAEAVSNVLARYNLTYGQYLIIVGTLEPRKNLQVVLQAYQLLPSALRKRFPLVVVGMKGWHTLEIERQMAPLVRAGEVRQVGYLKRGELAKIISGATTMLFPSIYEGFGLPPLEAMACGVPVIASGGSALPEVVGETGLIINPYDSAAVAEAIKKLIMDPSMRAMLSKKALTRSAEFTWEKCVGQTVGVYKQVCSQ